VGWVFCHFVLPLAEVYPAGSAFPADLHPAAGGLRPAMGKMAWNGARVRWLPSDGPPVVPAIGGPREFLLFPNSERSRRSTMATTRCLAGDAPSAREAST